MEAKAYRICFILLHLCLMYSGLTIHAQEASSPVPIFEVFELPGGKPGNAVQQVIQDSLGFLWFASEGGLHRWDGHHFKTYQHSAEDSTTISDNYVESLYIDREGQLWVGTNMAGLNLFNRQSETFTRFLSNPEDSSSLSGSNITSIIEDSKGNLWVGTKNGLNLLKKETGKFKRFINELSDKKRRNTNVWALHEDRQKRLWVGTEGGGLALFHPETETFSHFPKDLSTQQGSYPKFCLSIWENAQGLLWLGGVRGQVWQFDPESEEFILFPSNTSHPKGLSFESKQAKIGWVHSIMEDHENQVWIGANLGGLKRYDPKTNQVKHFFADQAFGSIAPTSNKVWSIFQDKNQAIWVAGAGGGHVYKVTLPKKHKKINIQQEDNFFKAFKETPLYSKLGDAHPGDRWLGPLDLALDPKDGTIWARFRYDAQIADRHIAFPILANYRKASGKIHFHHLKDLNSEFINNDAHLWNSSSNWEVSGMAIGKDGRVWSSYPSDQIGIFCYDPLTDRTKHYVNIPGDPNSLRSNDVVSIFMDSQGHIWIGYFRNGVSRLNLNTNQWVHFSAESLTNNQSQGTPVCTIDEDENGIIWVSGFGSICAIDPTKNKVRNFSLPTQYKIAKRAIRSMAFQPGRIFFSIDKVGLMVLRPDMSNNNFEFLTTAEQNFPLWSVNSMVFDQNGYLWMGSRLDKQFVCLDIEHKRWIVFENESSKPVADRKKPIINAEGIIHFPTSPTGWLEIDPDEMISRNPFDSSHLRLTELLVSDEPQLIGNSKYLSNPIWMLDELKLDHQATTFGFRFSAFDLASENVKYEYRLFPYQADWRFAFGKAMVEYFQVPPGTYHFQLRAYTDKGLLEQDGVGLRVIISPPWWETWWAYTLYIIAGLGLLSALFRYQRHRYQLQASLQLQQERADRLREMDQFKSRFYTNITHEFRTPLTVIKGMSEEIGKVKVKNMIQRNTDRLLAMVNQLLDLSKLENRSLPINWVQADIIPFLQYLTESCHSLAEKKKLNLAFFSKEDELVMDFDEIRMQQILINLLSNAIKFTPEYGSVKVIAAQVTKNDQDYLELSVKDTGKGIPIEKLPHIFDRFYQIDDSATRRGEGSGIGLALVKELVHLFDGQIEVKSEEGKGTSFMLFLPIHQQADKKEQLDISKLPTAAFTAGNFDAVPTNAPPTVDEEKPQVLIIEDNADVAEYIFSCLQQNYSLQTARNGQEGLEKALEHIPDVILCDVMMPEMDGFEVCRRLKADRRSSHIPIVLLTAKATQEDKITGLIQGADAYLTKPFDKEELLVRLRNLSIQSLRLRERINEPEKEQQQLTEQQQREADFIQEVNQVIESNMSHELFDTNFLCRAVMMSRTQLYRKLKALTGQSTAQYIRMARLQKAKHLLETTDLPAGEIAEQVGYKDFSHFSRSFAKAFNSTPSKTRK